jgi:hypothetical protein
MPRVPSKNVRDHAKASMAAFGKGKQPMKGPANARLPKEPDADDGAPPGTYRPHREPDADDENPGPQPFPPFKGKKKVGSGAGVGPTASKGIKAGKAKNMDPKYKFKKEKK